MKLYYNIYHKGCIAGTGMEFQSDTTKPLAFLKALLSDSRRIFNLNRLEISYGRIFNNGRIYWLMDGITTCLWLRTIPSTIFLAVYDAVMAGNLYGYSCGYCCKTNKT